MADEQYLTREGAAKLQRELDELINETRPALAQKLKEAVEQGDLKENADYHDTREKKSFAEGRIQYLENILRAPKIIEDHIDGPSDVARIGSCVTIEEPGEPPETYTIVGAAEANPLEGKISHESPLGAALLGYKVGDKVSYEAPMGLLTFKIKAID